MTTFIYALVDPFTGEIRYIGKANRPIDRLRDHLYNAERRPVGERTYRECWMMTLVRQGAKPILRILEEVLVEDWPDRERYWIGHYREAGSPLTNLCDGGRGVINVSAETRAKMSAKRKGWKPSPESVAKRVAALTGRKRSPEVCANISAGKKGKSNGLEGRKKSPEATAKTAAAHRGVKRSAESRAKMSAAHKGIPLPESVKQKLSEALKGRKRPPEVGAAISAAKKGKPLTEAGRAQRLEMRRKAWQAIGYSDIPEMHCGFCGASLYCPPSQFTLSKSGKVYCSAAHQMAAQKAAQS